MSTLEESLAAYASYLDRQAVASSQRGAAVGSDAQEEATMVGLDSRSHQAPEQPRRRTGLYATLGAAAALIAVLAVAFSVRDGSETVPAVPRPDSLRVEFDGADCSYDGPSQLSAGPIEVVYTNGGDATGSLVAIRLDEGRTFEQLREYAGSYPSTKHAPPWSAEVAGQPDDFVAPVGTWRGIRAGEEITWQIELEPGRYGFGCAIVSPLSVWVPGELTVT